MSPLSPHRGCAATALQPLLLAAILAAADAFHPQGCRLAAVPQRRRHRCVAELREEAAALPTALEAQAVAPPDTDRQPRTVRASPAILSDEELAAVAAESGVVPQSLTSVPPRGVFCTRSLDMEAIKCIGYDMDYTLIDYKMEVWEERAYHYCKEHLRSKGFPVSGLNFNPDLVTRGIIIDTEKGNLVKADRFGYVRRAMHGTRRLSDGEVVKEYMRQTIDLRSSRWSFLNTLFSVSEGCLYAQLVDRLDTGELYAKAQPPFDEMRCSSYSQLFQAVSRSLFKAHVTGQLKEEVMGDTDRFVNMDAQMCQALLDQRDAGKKLALITNSDWVYTQKLMQTVYDPFLPSGMVWTDLFDLVVVSACKPEFFEDDRRPVYEIATPDGMMRENFRFETGGKFAGGNARLLEKAFGIEGEEILYVGDHIYSDVNMAKRGLSWRTCLIMQELEREVEGLSQGAASQREVHRLHRMKQQHAAILNQLLNQRSRGAGGEAEPSGASEPKLRAGIARLQASVSAITAEMMPHIWADGVHVNPHWGYMSRAGFADKSHLMRQIEKYADIYTSRVSNFVAYTPYMHFRGPRQSLAHDTVLNHTSIGLAKGGTQGGAHAE